MLTFLDTIKVLLVTCLFSGIVRGYDLLHTLFDLLHNVDLVLLSHSFLNSMTVLNDVRNQLVSKPPFPDADFSGKTIIVTDANVGLGKEAVRHFIRLNAEKVIATVSSMAKGEAAPTEIEAETKRTGIVDLWALDSSYASVKAFTANVAKLPRVDAVVLNAGVSTEKF